MQILKKNTLEAKMLIQHLQKRRERERERENNDEDGSVVSGLIVSRWVAEVEGLKLQQWV